MSDELELGGGEGGGQNQVPDNMANMPNGNVHGGMSNQLNGGAPGMHHPGVPNQMGGQPPMGQNYGQSS